MKPLQVTEDSKTIDWSVEAQRYYEERNRLRAALHEIIDLDHHNMGPKSRAAKIACAALAELTHN